jgi:CheY-like chemotaxis protein
VFTVLGLIEQGQTLQQNPGGVSAGCYGKEQPGSAAYAGYNGVLTLSVEVCLDAWALARLSSLGLSSTDTSTPAVVLLVEDNESDIVLMRRAWQTLDQRIPLQVLTDGEEAIDYFKGLDQLADRVAHPRPSLVLLDLGLPGISGFDVLKWIRATAGLKELPVIVMTSSEFAADVKLAYDLGANSFMVKPSSFERLVSELDLIIRFWIRFNEVPDTND